MSNDWTNEPTAPEPEDLKNEIQIVEDEEEKEPKLLEVEIEEEPSKEADVTAEMRNLGRQLAETLRAAWYSEERQKIEGEVREGVNAFAAEVDKALREIRESGGARRIAEKAKEGVAEVKESAQPAEVSIKARRGLAVGLRWLSEELEKLAEQFTPPAKEPQDEAVDIEIKTE